MSRRRAGRGFTLVEVLIAITLLSLVMAGLLAALRTFGTTLETVEGRAGRAEGMRAVSQLLRQAVASAQPRDLRRGAERSQEVPLLEGGAREMAWIGLLPARHGLGGYYWCRLALVEDGERFRLVLRYRPYGGVGEGEAEYVLVEGVEAFSLAYQGEDGAPWGEAWEDPQHLPRRVRLSIRADGRDWPELVVGVGAADGAREG